MVKIQDTDIPYLELVEAAAPGTPAAGIVRIYPKTDGLMYQKDDAGTETLMSGGSGTLSDHTHAATGSGANGGGATLAPTSFTKSGMVVQVKTANSTADDATTAATMQNSSLSLAFTPLFNDSILHVEVDGEFNAYFSSGAGTATRLGWVGIYNSTNSAELVRQVRGGNLVAASTEAGTFFVPIALKGRYTVNSTAARTFVLQFMSGLVTEVAVGIRGTRTGGVTMTISEVRP